MCCQQVSAVVIQVGQALLRARFTFIGQVVGGAGEVVDGRNWLTQCRWAQY